MKAITLRQPWASLIATGIKTIETRPRPTKHRGRIAIHASKTRPHNKLNRTPLPLGAVVASAVLTDCVPMVGENELKAHRDGTHPLIAIANPDIHGELATWLSYLPNAVSPGRYIDKERSESLRAQLPYGDFRPGRWALLLEDIAPTTDRCPWCWGDLPTCAICDGARHCAPVPARGQQAVPWEWTPRPQPDR